MILALDTSAAVCRAFFGDPVNAPQTLEGMLRRYQGFHRGNRRNSVGALDMPGPTWRHRQCWDYKAGRKRKDPGLVDLLREAPAILRRCGWQSVGVDGYEADDVLATLARHYGEVTILTSDKDLYQLIRPGVRVWDLASESFVGRDDVWRKFGVDIDREPAETICELQALIGDQVDNIPGCPGIGKTAADRLIRAYGTAWGSVVAARAGEITSETVGKRWRSITKYLIAGADHVRMSRVLVGLVDVPQLKQQLAA